MRFTLILAAILGLAACSQERAEPQQPIAAPGAASTQAPTLTPVTDGDLINAANNAAEWLSYGRDYGETRFSP